MLQCERQAPAKPSCRYNRLRKSPARACGKKTCHLTVRRIEHKGNTEVPHETDWKTRLSGNAGDRRHAGPVEGFLQFRLCLSFTDYGPTYSAFAEGLDGGFQADAAEAAAKPLPVLYSENIEETLSAVESAGGTIVKPIFPFPGGRRFHFVDPGGNELAVWGE